MSDTQYVPTSYELRQFCEEQGSKVRELREKRPEDRGDTWQNDLRQATALLIAADAEFEQARKREAYDAALLTLTMSTGPSVHGAPELPMTAGRRFTESIEYRERSGNRSTDPVAVPEFRALLALSDSAGTSLFGPVGTPLPPVRVINQAAVRSLLPVQGTDLNSIPYIRETNAVTNQAGATTVAEGSAKPEATMSFEQADAPVRKIAAWVPVTDEAVASPSTLQGYIEDRLGYMLLVEENDQIINGNGTAPNVRGILNTTGVQTQAFSSDIAITVGLAVGKVEAVGGVADGVVMNPADYWSMMTDRHSDQFDGGFGGNSPFGTPSPNLWGVPVVRTNAVTAGGAIVGSWRLGATLFVRDDPTIRVTDSHSDYFIYNKLVILAEERIALAVHRPDFFVNTDTAA